MTAGQIVDLLKNVNRSAEVRLAVRPAEPGRSAQAEVWGATDELISVENGQPVRVVYLLEGGELGPASTGLWDLAV
jgi:hypothetical protein